MAQNRMAGDELEKDNPVAEEAKDSVQYAGKYGTLGERFTDDYVDEVKAEGIQDPTSNNGYSRKELASQFRYGRGDTSVDDLASSFQDMVDSGEFKGNNQAKDYLKLHGVNFGGSNTDTEPVGSTQPVETATPTPPININTGSEDITMPDPAPGVGDPYVGGTVIQDNDQVSSVVGDNNTVTQSQDNRVNRYGDGGKFKDMWMSSFFN